MNVESSLKSSAVRASHDDGHVPGARRALELAADLRPRHCGQHHVQEDEIRDPLPEQFQRVLAVPGGDGVEPCFAEVELHQVEDVSLVFDDEDQLLSRHAPLVYCTCVATR
jgi:hypothetical protein